MKILAFADLHGSLKGLKSIERLAESKNLDVIVCAGDISVFQRGFDALMYRLSNIGKPVLFVHGNHETEQASKEVCSFFENVFFIHKKAHAIGSCIFFGYGGGGFSSTDSRFEDYSKQLRKEILQNSDKKTVLVTHAPPYGTKLDKVEGKHYGNKSIAEFIKNSSITLAISGHFHENFGKKDRIGMTEIINPGHFGMVIKI